MKKWNLLCIGLLAAMALTLFGCGAGQTPEELTDTARAEINVPEDEIVEMTYAGACEKDGKALLWYISGNAHQAHRYLPVECTIADDGSYIFNRSFKPMDRGQDIAVHQWGSGYSFLINNKACAGIRITDAAGTEVIPVDPEAIPMVYYHDLLPTEYTFLDADGSEIP